MIFKNLKAQSSRHVLALMAVCTIAASPSYAQSGAPVFTPVNHQWDVGATQLSNVRGLKDANLPCVLSNEFDNGFLMRLSGGGQQFLAMAIDFRQNVFDQGRKYKAMIAVGDGTVQEVEVSAFTPTTLIFNLRPLGDFYSRVKGGGNMEIGLEGNTLKFALGQISRSFDALEACYANALAKPEPVVQAAATSKNFAQKAPVVPATIEAIEQQLSADGPSGKEGRPVPLSPLALTSASVTAAAPPAARPSVPEASTKPASKSSDEIMDPSEEEGAYVPYKPEQVVQQKAADPSPQKEPVQVPPPAAQPVAVSAPVPTPVAAPAQPLMPRPAPIFAAPAAAPTAKSDVAKVDAKANDADLADDILFSPEEDNAQSEAVAQAAENMPKPAVPMKLTSNAAIPLNAPAPVAALPVPVTVASAPVVPAIAPIVAARTSSADISSGAKLIVPPAAQVAPALPVAAAVAAPAVSTAISTAPVVPAPMPAIAARSSSSDPAKGAKLAMPPAAQMAAAVPPVAVIPAPVSVPVQNATVIKAPNVASPTYVPAMVVTPATNTAQVEPKTVTLEKPVNMAEVVPDNAFAAPRAVSSAQGYAANAKENAAPVSPLTAIGGRVSRMPDADGRQPVSVTVAKDGLGDAPTPAAMPSPSVIAAAPQTPVITAPAVSPPVQRVPAQTIPTPAPVVQPAVPATPPAKAVIANNTPSLPMPATPPVAAAKKTQQAPNTQVSKKMDLPYGQNAQEQNSLATAQKWAANAGETVKSVLSRWASAARYNLDWQSGDDSKVQKTKAYDGTFEEAVSAFLTDNREAAGLTGQVMTGKGARDLPDTTKGTVSAQQDFEMASVPAMHYDWSAPKGTNIQAVIDQWSARAGVNVVWQDYMTFTIKQNLNVNGSFEEAIGRLLDQYATDSERPIGQLNVDPDTGARTLLIAIDR